jgi:hypothetical protein
VDTGENPDAILYVPGHHEVYAFNGRGKSATVFEAKTGKIVATIPLSGKPEFAVFDPEADKIYNNIEDKNEVAVIDPKTHSVAARWPIAPGEAASGMALDRQHHRLFLGCDNKLMVMMDSSTGKVIATVPIGEGVDANVFDPSTGLAFSSNGEGTVTIASEDSPEKLIVVQTLKTARSARTMTIDPKTHRIYLAAADFEASPTPAPGTERQRPKMIPGTFRILVYGRANQEGEDGKAVEIEESIASSDLPAAVQMTLAKEYPAAKVIKAERMTKGNQILFELQIQIKDKKMGLTIDPNGKILEKISGAEKTEKK